MAFSLIKATVRFTNVPAGSSATLAHGLTVPGLGAVIPSALSPGPGANFFSTPTATTLTVSVTNLDSAPHSLDVLCEWWHTVERAFGDAAITTLTPTPFVIGAGENNAVWGTVIFPGANKAAEIQAVFDAGGNVQLLAGVYTIETPILLNGSTANHSGRRITGVGPATILRATFTGAADSPLNAFFVAAGTANLAKLNSTLTTSLFEAQEDFSVAAVAGALAANDWVLLSGNNSTLGLPFQFESDGVSVLIYEMLQLQSRVGVALVAKQQAVTNHAVGTTITGVAPVVGFTAEDLYLDGNTNGTTVACGITARSATGVFLRRLGGTGFSRFIVDFDQGVRNSRVEDLVDDGIVNGVVLFDSAHQSFITGCLSTSLGARYHLAGIPRAKLLFRNRPTGNLVERNRFAKGVAGIWLWGGTHNSLQDNHVTDMDFNIGGADSGYTRGVAAGEQGGTRYGVGYQTSDEPGALTEINIDNRIEDLKIENVVAVSHPLGTAAWIHDDRFCRYAGFSMVNRGRQFVALTTGARGLYLQDLMDCTMVSTDIQGLLDAVVTAQSNPTNLLMDGLSIGAVAGNAGAAPNGFYISNVNPSGWKIKDLRMGGMTINFLFRNASQADYDMVLENPSIGGVAQAGYCIMVKNESGVAVVPGQALALLLGSAAGTRKVQKAVAATPASQLMFWFDGTDDVLGAGKGFGFASALGPTPTTVVCTGTVNTGDLLEVSATAGVLQLFGAGIKCARAVTNGVFGGGTGLILAVALSQ